MVSRLIPFWRVTIPYREGQFSAVLISPLRTSLAIALIAALTAGCGGAPSSPSPDPPIESPFAGSWSGVATLESCTGDSGLDPNCGDGSSRTSFRATVAFDPLTNTYSGVMSTWFLIFRISGKVEPDGTLVMTGSGTSSFLPGGTATDWQLRTDGTALTGTFRFRDIRNVMLAARLDYVSLNGALPIPVDARFGVHVERTIAWRAEGALPAYRICAGLTNASSVGVRVVSATVIPIANGAEYTVEQLDPATRSLGPFASLLSPCFIARDQATRPFASSLRLRLELAYDDQVSGRLELTRPITVVTSP